MPPPRHNSGTLSLGKRTRLGSNGEKQKDFTGPEGCKPLQKIVFRSPNDQNQTAATSNPLTAVDDGGSRRSSRHRTVSKRLQDMELNFGTRKSQIKRDPEDHTLESSPRKKVRTSFEMKSNAPKDLDNKQERNQKQKEDLEIPSSNNVVNDSISRSTCSGETVTQENPNPNTEHFCNDTYKQFRNKENKEATTEQIQVKVSDRKTNISNLFGDVLNPSGTESKRGNSTIDNDSHDSVCPESLPQPEYGNVALRAVLSKDNVEESSICAVENSDSVVKESPTDISSESDKFKANELVEEKTSSEDLEKENDPDEDQEELTYQELTVMNPQSLQCNIRQALEGRQKIIEISLKEDAEDLNIEEMSENEPQSSNDIPRVTEDSSSNQTENNENLCSARTTEGDEERESQSVEPSAQLVVLDDGRQLLLSNADALATAADAVASLGQMKEVALIINGNISQPDSNPTEEETTNAMVQEGARALPKIKLITLNAPGVPSSSKPAVQELDMADQMAAAPPTVLSPDGFYRCSLCEYKTDKKANWYKHRYTHTSHRRYLCDKCEHRATTSSNLKRHMLIHSDIKVFKCNICNAEFRQKIHLERHVKYKHMKKVVQCPECNYVCANFNPDMKAHIKRRHPTEGEFLYRCDTCGFTAACKRDLKQHQKFHRRGPELKLYCEQCSFVTDCESRLRRHLLVHSRQRPFLCGVCPYRASQKEHVIRHLKTKHKMSSNSVYETNEVQNEEIITKVFPKEGTITILETDLAKQTCLTRTDDGRWIVLTQEEIEKRGLQEVLSGSKSESETESGQASASNSTEMLGCSSLDSNKEIHQQSASSEESSSQDGRCNIQNLVHKPSDGESGPPQIPEIVMIAQNDDNDGQDSTEGADGSTQMLGGHTSGSEEQRKPKKKYLPVDFSSKEKVFSCIHCTMKFAKLINLYKHLAVQHKDIQATKSGGLHSCVWCDYQTNKWKNLLVHMRKHNYREEYGVSTRYACVVCTYSSQHRKALYAHMMKKHKIQIYVKSDGMASCVIDDTIPGTMSSTDGNAVVLQRPPTSSDKPMEGHSLLGSVDMDSPSVITQPTGQQQKPATQTVMIELEAGMPPTAVEILAPPSITEQEEVDNEAADAIEGLQALAEQVMAVQQEQGLVHPEQHLAEHATGALEEGDGGSGEATVGSDGELEEQTQIHIQNWSGEVMEGQNIQLTPEQLMQLTSGDFIEINGEMYKVEVSEDGAAADDSFS